MSKDKIVKKYIPTGNEYIALPTIRESDASVEGVNVVMARLDGLLEIEGSPGRAFLSCDAADREAGQWAWQFKEHWIPEFQHASEPERRGLICAPPDQRFFIYRAPVAQGSAGGRFTLSIGKLFQTINVRHEIPQWMCRISPFNWSWTPGVTVDIFVGGTLLLTLSLRCPDGAACWMRTTEEAIPIKEGAPDVETSAPFELVLEPKGRPDLVVGFGLSRVGARSADLEVGRESADTWIARTEQWLAQRSVVVPGDAALSTKANRNGHFARFYAMARTLDTSDVVSMTSRSHRYYVSAAYWDRDSLLWLYPFLVRNDRDYALELLRYALGPQLRHAGIHSRQIGGQILEYGFELDELAAPLMAVGQWLQLYPETKVLEDNAIRRGVLELLGRLRHWRAADVALYRTELMPTDDLIVHGRDVLAYNNTLVLHTLRLLLPAMKQAAPEQARWMEAEIKAIPGAIRKHLVREGVFQWATDLKDSTEFYDEAAGSLLLLAHYGLCAEDDPTFVATAERLYSSSYPYCLPGPFSELGNRHTDGQPHPWVLSACNSVLSGIRREAGLDFLRRVPMDNGIACESVNVETGLPESGMHFATCAGFVAHAIAFGTGAYKHSTAPHASAGLAER